MEAELSMNELCLKMNHKRVTGRCVSELLPPSCVRSDPSYSAQIYFRTVEKSIQPQKVDFFMCQATADGVFEFLRPPFDFADAGEFFVAIDERLGKLYLIYGLFTRYLKVFDLSFDLPDRLGYRRIGRATEHSHRGFNGNIFKLGLTREVLCGIYALRILPSDGRLISHHTINDSGEYSQAVPGLVNVPSKDQEKASMQLGRRGFRPQASSFPAPCGLQFRDRNESKAYRFLFSSRLQHLLVLFKRPISTYLCSYDADLKHLNTLKIKPAELFQQLVPQNLHSSILRQNLKFRGNFDLLGHHQKYMLIAFDLCIVAVKWPKEWYLSDKLPPVTQTIVCNLGKIVIEKQKKSLEIMHFFDNAFYFCLRTLVPNSHDVIREYKRIDIAEDTKFKGYKRCANCNTVEKRKRHNTDGKRISGFKVCRICKSLNLHHAHDLSCYYCSENCHKLHWRKHKRLHKRRK